MRHPNRNDPDQIRRIRRALLGRAPPFLPVAPSHSWDGETDNRQIGEASAYSADMADCFAGIDWLWNASQMGWLLFQRGRWIGPKDVVVGGSRGVTEGELLGILRGRATGLRGDAAWLLVRSS